MDSSQDRADDLQDSGGSDPALPRLREAIRVRHCSLRTEQAYVHRARTCVRFHCCSAHPRDRGAAEADAFLTWQC